MCIACQNGPSIESEDTGVPRLCIRFRGKPDSEGDSLRADDYKPRTFIPLVNVTANGDKSFLSDWLKGRFGDPRRDPDIDDLGATSSARLEAIRGMLFYEPIWRAFLRRLMTNLVEDGVYWVELR
jgi:adenosine deaminase CECR1